ncbi:fibronectin type III domain-containing protein 1 [Scleropages formosus]|uniref:fibronectin type III domain-containing protein 1 n=1 Tax=Scleropages formosus TaxID=113540 RepID=UPI0010FAA852|nr:fibronectin type III domain-containing protein 1 [Scleropages formosus]
MSPATARTLLALLLQLLTFTPGATALRPLRPANVKLVAAEGGLELTWDPPEEADLRPVDHYIIGYGTSMKTLRFIKVDKDQRLYLLKDVEPGVLHFLKMTAENSDGMSKAIYRAETPKERPRARPPTDGARVQQGAPDHPSAPQDRNRGYLLNLAQSDRRVDEKPRLEGQRSRTNGQLASESVYVVSLQAQKALRPSTSAYRAALTKKPPADPDELYEAKDITVRVVSPQSVMVTWVDPAVEKEKSSADSRHYTVRYREKGESARWDYKETPQKRLLIDGLAADSMYEFSIRISQGDRNGRWSSSIFQRTPESAPTSPPENFHVKPLRGKGTAVTATWDPPDEANGRIREYILTYAPALQPFGSKSITYRGSTTSAVIDGLQPGNSYIFKIRATNRRGQGPSTKPFSIAMPTSSTGSSTSQNSKSQVDHKTRQSSSRASKPDLSKDTEDSDPQSAEETDEPLTSLPATSSPTVRRGRPLSQTRSYHSVISSARSPVRSGSPVSVHTTGSRSQGKDKQNNNNKEVIHNVSSKAPQSSDDSEEDLEKEDTKSKKPSVTQNQALLPEQLEDYRKHTSALGVSNPDVKTDVSSPKSPVKPVRPFLPKTPTYRRVTPVIISQGSFDTESNSPRITPSTSSRKTNHSPSTHQHKKQDGNTSPDLSNNHESALIKKDFTLRPDRKESFSQDTKMEPSVAPPQEATSKSDPKPSVLSQGKDHASDLTIHHSGSGDVNSKRKTAGLPRAASRVLHGQRNPVSSSTGLQSTFPTGAQNPQGSSESTDIYHTVKLQENDPAQKSKEEVTKDERLTSVSPILHSSTSSKSDVEKNSKSQESRTQQNNRNNVNTGAGHSHRLGVASRTSPRQETRVPVSRDGQSSSNGAHKLPLKEGASHSGVSSTKEPNTPSKHLSTSGSSRPTFPNRSPTVLSGLTNPVKSLPVNRNPDSEDSTPHLSGSTKDDNDYVYQDNKDPSKKKDQIVATSAPQSTASAVNEAYRPQPHDNDSIERDFGAKKTGSSSIPSIPRRPVLRPNGRFRSPSNRQIGPRFSGRLLPAQHTKLGSSNPLTESSRLPSSSSFPQSPDRVGSANGGSSRVSSSQLPHSSSRQTSNVRAHAESSLVPKQAVPASLPASSPREPMRGTRWRHPSRQDIVARGKQPSDLKPSYEQGKNGRPNLTVSNGKVASTSDDSGKPAGRRFITGPDGAKWIVDLDKGVLMNEEGRVLQDSQGQPRRVVLGEDGRTIFDLQGSPLVNPEGLALFGHGRDSRPVINPKEKFFTLGGKPIVGLDRPKPKTTTSPPTTPEPTTVPTTTEMTTEETTTMLLPPTCPPGTFSRMDEQGFPLLDADGVVSCYLDEWSSGMDAGAMATTPAPTLVVSLTTEEDDFVIQSTLPPTTDAPSPEPQTSPFNSTPSSELDAAGNKRFTAPYVNYIRKDPGAPCSLTEALEYLQVDVLENLLEKDSVGQKQPPKNKPHNITVVAMEGCHSFVILDWARPLKGDMVSGYMVHSASYDDVLNNRWSSSSANGTHLAVENLKPNSRYYFKVQAKNIFGLGPVSDTFTYVTESDDPLLIERPPGGEPIWIPFSFKYNPTQSSCKGSQFVKRTWYRKFVGVVLCNSLRYKIFMGDGLKDTFYSIGDTYGHGEDHCQFVDSYLEGRTGPHALSDYLPTTQGFFRSYRQEPVSFGPIGRRTPHPYVGWYECGVPIPGKW